MGGGRWFLGVGFFFWWSFLGVGGGWEKGKRKIKQNRETNKGKRLWYRYNTTTSIFGTGPQVSLTTRGLFGGWTKALNALLSESTHICAFADPPPLWMYRSWSLLYSSLQSTRKGAYVICIQYVSTSNQNLSYIYIYIYIHDQK